jgi:hypothetical protein
MAGNATRGGHKTENKLPSRRGPVHSIGWLCSTVRLAPTGVERPNAGGEENCCANGSETKADVTSDGRSTVKIANFEAVRDEEATQDVATPPPPLYAPIGRRWVIL